MLEGPATWLTGIVVLGGGAAVVLAIRALMGRKHRRLAHRQVFCPRYREWVDCTLAMSTLTGTCVDVDQCSEFDPPDSVSCDRICLRELNAHSA